MAVIRRAFRETGVDSAGHEGTKRPRDDADVHYLFRPRAALVRDNTDDKAHLDEFLDFFARREGDFNGRPVPGPRPVAGLVLVELPTRKDEGDPVLATLEELDGERAANGADEVIAQPDHVLYVTPGGRLCPDTEPEPPRGTTPVPDISQTDTAGTGVRVAVVDTGWWKEAASHQTTKKWLANVVADQEDEEVLQVDANGQNIIHEYAGHGTFVAGVIKCMAPSARVEVEGLLTKGGAIFESEICEQLDQALDESDLPQIISISGGTHTRKNMGLLGLEMLAAAYGLDDGVKTLVVAAAGNDESDREFYPAAYPWVIGVGSVDADGKVSKFSNFGKWVDVWARGRDIVNAFPVGTYTCHYPENMDPVTKQPQVRTFDGLARWSGTSFATPIVAGAIAAQMSATNSTDNPRKAYDELVAASQKSVPQAAGGKKIVGPL
ncbi:S8 family peptidase [Nocardioides stalactiti]|uniref:S8 family peptidase n=1 Tax=Nocardioides stalactiti TaxID=2755356 RepID=UPI0016048252|nr:S8 family serine peptidase [Nocardioides stalactiti]